MTSSRWSERGTRSSMIKSRLALLFSLFPIVIVVILMPIVEHHGKAQSSTAKQGAIGSIDTTTVVSEVLSPVPHLHGSSFVIPRRFQNRHNVWKYRSMCQSFSHKTSTKVVLNPNFGSAEETKMQTPKAIVVIGERHSGTDWLLNQLTARFPRTTVGNVLNRPRFLFQDISLLKSIDLSEILVVLVTRHPLTWLLSMYYQPIHAPAHLNKKPSDFFSLEWSDSTWKSGDLNRPKQNCQYKFEYKQVSPCRKQTVQHNPLMSGVYEHDQVELTPYENIIKFRAEKMKHYQLLLDTIPNAIVTSMEELSTKEGIESLENSIQKQFPDVVHCLTLSKKFRNAKQQQISLDIRASSTSKQLKNNYSQVSQKDIQKLYCAIDWEQELYFGYERESTAFRNQTTELKSFQLPTDCNV